MLENTMPIILENTIPLGRRKSEYYEMFNLNDLPDGRNILDCEGGPSSFNFEMKDSKNKVVSIDPLYQFSKFEINNRINETFSDIKKQTYKNRDKFIWNNLKNINDWESSRKSAMELFISDFENGKNEKRYIHQELPDLSFQNNSFDIAICSHFLFLYSNNFNLQFHIDSILEMLRVAGEVRIFPLVDLNAQKSIYVDAVVDYFSNTDIACAIVKTNYEFQKGSNEYLKLTR
jgi:hypothetical protein